MFKFLYKQPKTKIDRCNDFIADLRKVYGKHSEFLSPKEMQVCSKERVNSLAWINGCTAVVKSIIKRGF